MSKRAAKFVSAIFASLLAGAPFATVSQGAQGAQDPADSCLSGPKGALPQGGHWYYRIDRATKRHCWYVGDEKEKLSRAAPGTSPSPDDSASPPVFAPKDAATQRSIADARAELPMPQTRVGQDFAGQRAPPTATDAVRPENDQLANAGDADSQRSVFASRWPELAGVSSSAGAAPSTAGSKIVMQSNSQAAPPPAAAAAAVTLAAADTSSAGPSGSIPQLLTVIVGSLSLAGLIAGGIFRFGRARRHVRIDRRVSWDSARTHRPSLADEARAAASMREVSRLPEDRVSRAPRAADDPNDRTAQMLARLTRSAAS